MGNPQPSDDRGALFWYALHAANTSADRRRPSRSRSGLRALLDLQPEIVVAGEAADGRQAVRLVEELRPDVVLMDARMPVMDGLEATCIIKERWPTVKVIVLTIYPSHRADALAAGADEFLVKGFPAEDLVTTIQDQQKEV
jgi:DNA-binding NarL/FixJ family response regulator